jgi:hypothetical protein
MDCRGLSPGPANTGRPKPARFPGTLYLASPNALTWDFFRLQCRSMAAARAGFRHGTAYGYVDHKCRCAECCPVAIRASPNPAQKGKGAE